MYQNVSKCTNVRYYTRVRWKNSNSVQKKICTNVQMLVSFRRFTGISSPPLSTEKEGQCASQFKSKRTISWEIHIHRIKLRRSGLAALRSSPAAPHFGSPSTTIRCRECRQHPLPRKLPWDMNQNVRVYLRRSANTLMNPHRLELL